MTRSGPKAWDLGVLVDGFEVEVQGFGLESLHLGFPSTGYFSGWG